ncbi:hypothetical protein E2562_011447 [Oryza meyeriana var. granulata]|uniref:Uncharacterized protein n=1 Tax=Oryza meyeriana var. granulata TaxID=110450 RepID=A0A6G1D282_9ORYZ|nr:hypothetical protein E2562_011447 [Oryza meyeriana var. granulata]
MGKGLQRLTQTRCGKLPVVISEGRTRPVVPLVAAKFATECNIAVRNHLHVFKHWKDYKDQPGLFRQFLEKIAAKFNINTNDEQVKRACSEMMKAVDEQWNDLVEYWKSPKKMGDKYIDQEPDALDLFKECHYSKKKKGFTAAVQSAITQMENKLSAPTEGEEPKSATQVVVDVLAENTKKNQFLQNVGIQNGDKYIDQEPDALDLFKECHYSKKKKGFTAAVQSAITQMENKLSAPTEGEEPKSATQVVVDVLAENTKKNQFLQNVGIQNVRPRSSVQDIEAELEVEKRANAELRSIVDTQREKMDELSKQVQETEQARIQDQEEMKKKQAEMVVRLPTWALLFFLG